MIEFVSETDSRLIGVLSLSYLKDRTLDRINDIKKEGGTNIPLALSRKIQEYIDDKFPEVKDEFVSLTGTIATFEYREDTDTLADKVAKLLQGFLAKNFALEELEERMGGFSEKVDPDFVLSDLLHAERPEKDKTGAMADFVLLHIRPGASRGGLRVIQLLVTGLQKLAENIKNHPKYEGVKEIRVDSYLVAENPKVLGSFGFEVNQEAGREAVMSLETLFEKYDNTSQS